MLHGASRSASPSRSISLLHQPHQACDLKHTSSSSVSILTLLQILALQMAKATLKASRSLLHQSALTPRPLSRSRNRTRSSFARRSRQLSNASAKPALGRNTIQPLKPRPRKMTRSLLHHHQVLDFQADLARVQHFYTRVDHASCMSSTLPASSSTTFARSRRSSNSGSSLFKTMRVLVN